MTEIAGTTVVLAAERGMSLDGLVALCEANGMRVLGQWRGRALGVRDNHGETARPRHHRSPYAADARYRGDPRVA